MVTTGRYAVCGFLCFWLLCTLVVDVAVICLHRGYSHNNIAGTNEVRKYIGLRCSPKGALGASFLPTNYSHMRHPGFLSSKMNIIEVPVCEECRKSTSFQGSDVVIIQHYGRKGALRCFSLFFNPRDDNAASDDVNRPTPGGRDHSAVGNNGEEGGPPTFFGARNKERPRDSRTSPQALGEVTENALPGEITDEEIMKMKIALSQQSTLGLDFVKVIEVLQTSPYCTVSANTIAYNAALSAANRNNNAQLTLSVIEDMRKKGNVLDAVSYKLAISTCSKCGKTDEAMELYNEMLKNGHPADHGVMRSLMFALAKEGKGTECFALFEDMKRLDKVAKAGETFMQQRDYVTTIEACTKAEMYQEALETYKEMKTLKNYEVSPDVITAILTLCHASGRSSEAMEIYGFVLKENKVLTLYQYKLLMTIMLLAKKYAELESIYNCMYKMGVCMDYMVYQLVLEGWAKTGQFKRSMMLIEKMEPLNYLNGRFEPFIAAVEACRKCGEWKLALKLLRLANESNTSKSIELYNTVLSVLAAAEEWDAVISLYTEIEEACKQSSGGPDRFCKNGDTVAYAVMAHFYTGNKTQVDRLLSLPVVDTTLLLKLRNSIEAEDNVHNDDAV